MDQKLAATILVNIYNIDKKVGSKESLMEALVIRLEVL